MKNILRKALCAALALILAVGLFPLSSLAADGDMSNFTAVRQYTEQFADVASEAWYHDNVALLYELGLTNGMEGNFFGSDLDISLAEVISFSARVHSIYHTGSLDAIGSSGGGKWYEVYVDYMVDRGLIDAGFAADCERPATRAEAAHLMAVTLPQGELADINSAAVEPGYLSGAYIRDVNSATRFGEDILLLYTCGVVAGSNESGDFFPESAVARREFAAMLTRLVRPGMRVKIAWSKTAAGSAKGTAMADLISGEPEFTASHAPDDAETIKSNIAYMLKRNELTLSLDLGPWALSEELAHELMCAYQKSMYDNFFEQSCRGISVTYSIETGHMDISFGCYTDAKSNPTAENQKLRGDIIALAADVHDELWASGTLTGDMSQREIARVYYTWLADNCEYADDETKYYEVHSALGVFSDGVGVCDGYVSAYNLLLRLEGIDCSVAYTDNHIWTVAELDGVTCHIDPTWGDQGKNGVSYAYFAMTEAEAWARF